MRASKYCNTLLIVVALLAPLPSFAQLSWGPGGAGGTGTWNAANINWYNGASNQAWVPGDSATFAGTAAGVSVTGTQNASSLTFSNTTGTYSLSGGSLQVSSLGGAGRASISSTLGGVSKFDTGTITIAGTNTGGVAVYGGVLSLSSPQALTGDDTSKWNGQNVYVASTGTLAFSIGAFTSLNLTNLSLLLNTPSGAGGGFQNNSTIGFDTTLGSAPVPIVINDANSTSGSVRNVSIFGGRTIGLLQHNTYTGLTTVQSGTLAINYVGTGASAQSLGEGSKVVMGTAGGSAVALLYGPQEVTGAGPFFGGAAGTLDKGIDFLADGIIQNSGTQTLGATYIDSPGALTLSGTITHAHTALTLIGNAQGLIVTGQITGGTSADFNSAVNITVGTTTLSNAGNNYTGSTTIFGGGTLQAGVTNALPVGTVLTVGKSTDTSTAVNTFDLNGFSQTVASLNSPSVAVRDNVTNNAASGTGTLTLSGVNSDGVGVKSVYSGNIKDGATASIALAITSGTHTLQGGLSSYTGGTTVNGGVLIYNLQNINAATGAGNITVNSGVLKGNSTLSFKLGQSIVVASGGLLQPGTTAVGAGAITNLSLSNNGATAPILNFLAPGGDTINVPQLSFNLTSGSAPNDGSGLTFAGRSNYIKLLNDVAGEVQFNNNLVELNDLTGGKLVYDGKYLLFDGGANSDYAGLTVDQFGRITAGLSLTGSFLDYYDSSGLFLQNGDIYVDVIPEPGTWSLLAVGLAGLAFLRRRRSAS